MGDRTAINRARLHAIAERELVRLWRRTPRSYALHQQALASMPEGLGSGVMAVDPYPIVVRSGRGAQVVDVDGNRYVDYANGFGVSVYGHGDERIAAAIAERAACGTHFGALSEPLLAWSQLLCERFGLDWVRFAGSGSEALQDAVRLARAATGRHKVAKVEGAYHGTWPEGLVSNNALPVRGPLRRGALPRPRSASEGLLPAVRASVAVVPFNDLEAAERALAGHDVACMLVEPILFNVGAIFPQPDYLQGLRELCRRSGTLLVFDEVKTALTVAYGGAEELFGVRPDVKVFGKGIGGGVPCAALGSFRPELREPIEQWRTPLGGTFSGNPLAAAAGSVVLGELLVPSAYDDLNGHYALLAAGLDEIVERYELPAYITGVGAKGCIVWSRRPLRDYRDYCRRFDVELAEVCWLVLVNRGLYLHQGHDEQWTHSLRHGAQEAGRFLEAFAAFAGLLRG
jgi:glutamate-1-semialdehyde 2,1-aminomutase